MTCFSFDAQSRLFPHWLPSHFVPLTTICCLYCMIYIHVHSFTTYYPSHIPWEKGPVLCFFCIHTDLEESGAFLRCPVPLTFLITKMRSFFPHCSWRRGKSLNLGDVSCFFFQFQTENVVIFNLWYIKKKKKFHLNLFLLLGVYGSTLKIF